MTMISRRKFVGTAALATGMASAQQSPKGAPGAGSGPSARKPTRIVKLFKSPDGHPNGLETTAEGLWIGEEVTERACLVDWNCKLIRKIETESHNTSGIAVG